jgi:hypothetical protein
LAVLAAGLFLGACATGGRSNEVATAEEVEGSDEVSEAEADRNAASQRAPSQRPSEGGGGHVPHPVATGPQSDPRYGEQPAPEPGPSGRPVQSGSSAGGSEVNGRIALVDQANREIAVDAGTTTTQFRVAENAEITVDGQKATLADLPQGAQIRASLDRSGELPEATRIEVTPKKGN